MAVDRDSPYLEPALAAVYERFAAPAQFARPARDLVDLLGVAIGNRALDVGTGTGVVASALAEAVSPEGLVVGIDPSIEMLRAGGTRTPYRRSVARVPGLPFRHDVFDVVAASFVITHLSSYSDGLADMVRVCKPGGRVGVTTWGTLPNPAGALWKQVAATVVPEERLADAFRRVIPWEEPLCRAGHLERALRDARLTRVQVAVHDYVVSIAVDDYVAMKAATVEGTLLRRMLEAERWNRFLRDATEAFQARFGRVVDFVRDFNVGIGSKGGE